MCPFPSSPNRVWFIFGMSEETPQPAPAPPVTAPEPTAPAKPADWRMTAEQKVMSHRAASAKFHAKKKSIEQVSNEARMAQLRIEVAAAIVRGAREQIAIVDDPQAKQSEKRAAMVALRSVYSLLKPVTEEWENDEPEDNGEEYADLRNDLEQMKGTGTNG